MTTAAEKNPFTKSKSMDVPDIDLSNIDELLANLTKEEIEELNGDFDPDNSLLPPGHRQRDQTDKSPTGAFNRKALLKFLEKKAKEEKDWEQNKPYEKKTRGKIYEAKKETKPEPKDAEEKTMDTEWDDLLTAASEEELVDLAAVLGFHSMLTQTQYYDSLQDKKITEGFKAAAKGEEFKPVPDLPPNPTDVDESIEKLQNNDGKFTSLNLNNIKNISEEKLIEICEALKSNSVLETLELANVRATDRVARKLAEGISENKTVKILNLESNFIAGENIVEILNAINKNQVVTELHISNQKPDIMGNKIEMKILKLVEENNSLLVFGIDFESAHCRVRTIEKLKDNVDNCLRKKRAGDNDKKPAVNGKS